MQRLIVLASGCLVLLGVTLYVQHQQSPYFAVAQSLMGESWFRINLETQHVGYLYNSGFRDAHGRLHFTTTTHFLLQDGAPNTITKHLVFSARLPHPLVWAHYENRLGSTTNETLIVAADDTYTATLSGSNSENQVSLDWVFGLEDFVGFEHWLQTEAPVPQAQRRVRAPDFERLRITSRTYEVMEHNDTGYRVQTSAPLSATETQLDEGFRPVRLNMAGVFNIVASDEADAIALTELHNKTSYLFPLDQRLNDHTQLTRLHLQIDYEGNLPLPRRLELKAGTATASGDTMQYTSEELRYPIADSTIQALVQRALAAPGAQTAPAETLLLAAHETLRYTEGRPAGSVLEAVRRGIGECTDYADLYTTLARAAGLPARTVYGLAYKDGTPPSFMFHAWNEVHSDGAWRAMDPTWNQTVTDATHIPLTDSQAANLMLAHSRSDVAFSVTRAEYL